MKIGIFAWQPELINPEAATSAGGASWMRYLIDQYNKAGHEVLWLTPEPIPGSPAGTQRGAAKECDIAIICWRWQMPGYPERNGLYIDQQKQINEAYDAGTKIIVHDQDHMIAPADLATLFDMGIRVYSPELFPPTNFRTLMFPDPFEGRHLDIEARSNALLAWDLVYVGNVYGRYEQALKYFNGEPELRIKVLGNWLEEGPDRPSPEKVVQDFPGVYFGGRIRQSSVITNLAEGGSTIHLHKHSYGPSGFVTLRWAEAAHAGIPAFIPEEFALPHETKQAFSECGLVVGSNQALWKAYSGWTESEWRDAVRVQRNFVRTYMRIDPWFKILEE